MQGSQSDIDIKQKYLQKFSGFPVYFKWAKLPRPPQNNSKTPQVCNSKNSVGCRWTTYTQPLQATQLLSLSLLGIRQRNERRLGQAQGLLEILKEYSRNPCQLHAKPQTIKQSCLTVDNSKQNDIAELGITAQKNNRINTKI